MFNTYLIVNHHTAIHFDIPIVPLSQFSSGVVMGGSAPHRTLGREGVFVKHCMY